MVRVRLQGCSNKGTDGPDIEYGVNREQLLEGRDGIEGSRRKRGGFAHFCSPKSKAWMITTEIAGD